MVLAKQASYNAPCVVLGKDRLWWVFLLSSITMPFILSAFVLLARTVIWIKYLNRKSASNRKYTFKLWKEDMDSEIDVPWVTKLRDAADNFVSTRYRIGQVMAFLTFVFSMASLFIYYNTVSYFIFDVEQCQPWQNNASQQVDFAFNCFFFLNFVLRFVASSDKITMIFNLYSIIDYFTVPPALCGLIFDRDWIGLKFLRVIYLRRVSTILASMNIMTSTAKIKLTQLGLTWIAILLAAGGLFHLVENSGDPFFGDYDGQRVTYWDFCYFAFGTMATLGSADTNVKTILGKLTNCFLVMIVLAVIAVALPDVTELMGKRRKYDGEHRKVHNEKHIVVCGDITHDSVLGFFQEFFHPDRDITNIKIICLSMLEPDMEFARFLKKNMFQISYLQGSLLSPRDLYRTKLHEADACMILADKSTTNADAEDSNNIMRVVAVKNYHPPLRVIVQLLQYRSKSYLTSIPNWNPHVGDDVICLPEIKLGLLAQSCAAPGFSTLMANIFASRSSDTSEKYPEWMNNYLLGAGMEMYTEKFGDSFGELTFLQAVELCYTKLNILLFAISTEPVVDKSYFAQSFILNPPSDFIVKPGTSGCFMADSSKEAQTVMFYCKMCHADVDDPSMIKPCACGEIDAIDLSKAAKTGRKKSGPGAARGRSRSFSEKTMDALDAITSAITNGHHGKPDDEKVFIDLELRTSNPNSRTASAVNNTAADSMSESTTTSVQQEFSQQKYFSSFEKKIVYFMRNFGSLANWKNQDPTTPVYDEDGDLLDYSEGPRYDSTGMFWWCPPKAYEDVLMDRFQAAKMNFRQHVVLVVFADETSSVIGLNNFVMPLRSSNSTYDELRDIVILGDPSFLHLEWLCLQNFPKITMVKVFGLSRADLRAVNIHLSDMCLLLTAASAKNAQDTLLSDKDPILASLTIKAMNFGVIDDYNNDAPITFGKIPFAMNDIKPLSNIQTGNAIANSHLGAPLATIGGYAVPLLTELINDSNVQFVDQDDEDLSEEFFMAEPFACGNTFATSVLQSLMVSTYFNPFCLAILRSLIFGGITPEFEQILAEGAGLIGGQNLSRLRPYSNRCIMGQISIQDSRFSRHSTSIYSSLFLDALRNHNIVCLGIYRRIEPLGSSPRSLRRYVITNPPKDFLLKPDDRIFIVERSRHFASW